MFSIGCSGLFQALKYLDRNTKCKTCVMSHWKDITSIFASFMIFMCKNLNFDMFRYIAKFCTNINTVCLFYERSICTVFSE